MNQKGFTLIELLVTLAVASIVMGAVFVMYNAQLQTQATRLASTEMTQHARAAMMILEREIRSAATDPTGYAGAEFITAALNEIRFTRDITGGEADSIDNDRDGQTDEVDGLGNPDEWYNADIDPPPDEEDIRYRLWTPPMPGQPNGIDCDANNDGLADSFPCSLCRYTGGDLPGTIPPPRVSDNVEVLNFVYLDNSGNVLDLVTNPTFTDRIRAVQVTLIARSDNPVLMRDQTDRTNYTNLQGTVILPAPNDTVRRIVFSTEIRVRNTGLKS